MKKFMKWLKERLKLTAVVGLIAIGATVTAPAPAKAEPITATILVGTAVAKTAPVIWAGSVWAFKFIVGKAVLGTPATVATAKGASLAVGAGAARGAVVSKVRTGAAIMSRKSAEGTLRGAVGAYKQVHDMTH